MSKIFKYLLQTIYRIYQSIIPGLDRYLMQIWKLQVAILDASPLSMLLPSDKNLVKKSILNISTFS